MNIISYFHPIRTYLPCSGVGRHIINILLGLHDNKKINLSLLVSSQWVDNNGKLSPQTPLRNIPTNTYPFQENITERLWKTFGYPKMNHWIPNNSDWLYAPVETYIPVTKYPVAVTIHDIQPFETNLPWSQSINHKITRLKWGKWVKKSIENSQLVFTVSDFSKQRMVSLLNANPNKIVVIPNGIDDRYFKIANKKKSDCSRPIQEPYILVMGGLREKKGGKQVLAVAKELQKQKSEIQLVVVGEENSDYNIIAKEFSNIHIFGMVDDETIPQWLHSAEAMLFLSLYEGFGMPILEAMATGTHVIASHHEALLEVGGKTPFFVNPNNTQEIIDIINEITKYSQSYKKRIFEGNKYAQSFTWDTSVKKLIQTLDYYK